MNKELQKYLDLQQEEFDEYCSNIDKTILVAADSLESLEKFYEQQYGVKVNEYEAGQAYIIKMEDGLHHLFIKGTNKKYREIFKKFLNEEYGVPTDEVPECLNVDHVFNKARAEHYFIRMILLNEKANKNWGRAYERSMSRIDKKRGSVNKSLILLDYSVILKVLELPSFKKGDIKGKEDIKKIASEARVELEKLFGIDTIPFDIIEKFYRAELNLLKYGNWSDPFYVETVPLELKVSRLPQDENNEEFESLVHEIKRIFQSILDENLFEFPGTDFPQLENHKYKIRSSSALNKGIIIMKEANEVCQNLLGSLENAFEIEWELKVREKLIYFMVIRIYLEGYNDEDTIKYEFYLDIDKI